VETYERKFFDDSTFLGGNFGQKVLTNLENKALVDGNSERNLE